MKLEVAASSHSSHYYICKIVLGLFFSLAHWMSSQSNQSPSPYSTVLLQTHQQTDRQTDILPPSLYVPTAREQRQYTHRPQQTQGWEQRHSGAGQHAAGPDKAPDETLGSIATAAAPLTLMHSELGHRCDVGALLDISCKFCSPQSAAWRKDPSPSKSKVRGYAAFPAARNDNS